MRREIANSLSWILPATPGAGPPLPDGLNVIWPTEVLRTGAYRASTKIVSPIDSLYTSTKLKVLGLIRGY